MRERCHGLKDAISGWTLDEVSALELKDRHISGDGHILGQFFQFRIILDMIERFGLH